jgi:hypothetical protein
MGDADVARSTSKGLERLQKAAAFHEAYRGKSSITHSGDFSSNVL